jgi:D-sedoheptulose 7-phosphate isomerase
MLNEAHVNTPDRPGSTYLADLAAVGGRIEASAGGGPLSFDVAVLLAAELIATATAAGRRIFFIGNGGSAAIASHMATDYMKNGGMRALAFNDSSLLTCLSNDYGYGHVFEQPVRRFAERGDLLVAISSSGQSENICAAAAAATERGCRVVTLSGFDAGNRLRSLGDLNFYVPSRAYGQVEILHLVVCHCILDMLIARGEGAFVGEGALDV